MGRGTTLQVTVDATAMSCLGKGEDQPCKEVKRPSDRRTYCQTATNCTQRPNVAAADAGGRAGYQTEDPLLERS